MARYKYIKQEMTIGQLVELSVDDLLDMNPAYQRDFVADIGWCQLFIAEAVFQGDTAHTLHFRRMKNRSFQVLDGIQRITAILNFLADKFRTPGSKNNPLPIEINGHDRKFMPFSWSEMEDQDVRDHFLDTVLTVFVYDVSMTDSEAHKKFLSINRNNSLNHQEKRNGYPGDLAEWVRESARPSMRANATYAVLPIFSPRTQINGKKVYSLGMPYKRMNYDELIAKAIQYEVWDQDARYPLGIFTAYNDKKALDDLYEEKQNAKNLPKWEKRTTERFDWVYSIIQASPKPHEYTKAPSDILTLYQLSFIDEIGFGRAKYDFTKLSKSIWLAFGSLLKRSNYPELRKKEDTPFGALRSQYDPDQVKDKLALLVEKMKELGDIGILLLDKNRCFEASDILEHWHRQGEKCYTCGGHITIGQAQGGHKNTAYIKGGKNDETNLIVQCKKCNCKMGTKSVDEFMEMTCVA